MTFLQSTDNEEDNIIEADDGVAVAAAALLNLV